MTALLVVFLATLLSHSLGQEYGVVTSEAYAGRLGEETTNTTGTTGATGSTGSTGTTGSTGSTGTTAYPEGTTGVRAPLTSAARFASAASSPTRLCCNSWQDVNNGRYPEGDYAKVDVEYLKQYSEPLILSNFGFNLPAGTKIIGIVVDVLRKYEATGNFNLGYVRDDKVRLQVNGLEWADLGTRDDSWSHGEWRWDTYGSATSLNWVGVDIDVTAEQVSKDDFGVWFAAEYEGPSNSQAVGMIDAALITVYHSPIEDGTTTGNGYTHETGNTGWGSTTGAQSSETTSNTQSSTQTNTQSSATSTNTQSSTPETESSATILSISALTVILLLVL